MSWRPKDWENDRFDKCLDLTKGGGEYSDIYEVFEAGADAILKELLNWLDYWCENGTPRRECGHCWSLLKEPK